MPPTPKSNKPRASKPNTVLRPEIPEWSAAGRSDFVLGEAIIFQIEDVFYRLDKARLIKLSTFFKEMFDDENTGYSEEGSSSETPIVIGGIMAQEMDAFLRVFLHSCFDEPLRMRASEWSDALHIATMWRFEKLRKYIIKRIDEAGDMYTPLEHILMARRCRVGKWLLPAYMSLCTRDEPISEQEGHALGMSILVGLWNAKERFRGENLGRRNRSDSPSRDACDCSPRKTHHSTGSYVRTSCPDCSPNRVEERLKQIILENPLLVDPY